MSSNITDRLYKHNRGWSKSTKPYLPWILVYTESYIEKGEAYKREAFLKSPGGYLEKRKIIASIKM